MVDPDDVKDVLAVIGLDEDGTQDCNNAVLDHETGLTSATVDEVLEYLWKSDQIEGILTLGVGAPRSTASGESCPIGTGCGVTMSGTGLIRRIRQGHSLSGCQAVSLVRISAQSKMTSAVP